MRKPRAAEVERCPLSPSQEFLCDKDEGEFTGSFGHRHILVNGWRITGKVGIDALQGALNDLVARHEILRTRVVRDGDPRHQEIHPPCPAPLVIRDLPPAVGKSRDLQAEELLNEAEAGTLSVRQLPLLRAVLGRFDDGDWALVLIVHHTATDAWSMSVLARDLMSLYSQRCGSDPPGLPEVRQYREFARIQRARSADDATGAYWREKLDGARIFRLPAQREPADHEGSSYSARVFTIGAATTAAAIALAKAMNGSLFMVLLAAFYRLANEITGTTDPVVPTFSLGRDPQFFDTVGFCVNFLPIRTSLPAGPASFREIVTLTKASCLDAYTHEVPFVRIVSQAPGLMAGMSKSLALVLFEVVQTPADTRTGQAGNIAYAEIVRRHPLAGGRDLPGGMLWAFEVTGRGETEANAIYDQNQFGEPFMDRLIARYQQILTESLAEPDQRRELRSGVGGTG
ncbi:MAG TPA: condensation domain-containing protein [Streptosporangiaceae bacterium]|nr:condensation domain-containing protein [Streptosporangiaceae bacterium]